jgi:uncharacterized membrane protein YsdA (DUF1294 family)/cold shock CspA family protein
VKGFGFITPLAGGKQVFIHIKAFGSRNRRPEINDVVTFALAKDKQGRPCAVNATLAGDKLKPDVANQRSAVAILLASLFLGAVGVSVVTGHLPAIIGIACAVLSLITFGAYAVDKSAARRGAWRTAESTLHFLGLVGGWPGALIAQQTLRHKSKKPSFRLIFWITVLIDCETFLWLHTEIGRTVLATVLA